MGYLREEIVEKPESDRWHAIIADALAADAGGRTDSLDLSTIARFIEFADARVQVTRSNQGV